MDKFYYEKHGLLFIVYEYIETGGLGYINAEDSRWTDEEQAKEHCRILNEQNNG